MKKLNPLIPACILLGAHSFAADERPCAKKVADVYPIRVNDEETLVVDPRGLMTPRDWVEKKLREIAERSGITIPVSQYQLSPRRRPE